jgi:hypothetical protein
MGDAAAAFEPPNPVPRVRSRRRDFWVRTVVQGLVLLAMMVPFVDFLRVSLWRMQYPFELEWLEGEVAIYSVRWLEKASLAHLYPAYSDGGYVPHLYAPLFQILAAHVHAVSGMELLASGRFLSLLSTFLIMAGIAAIVRDVTRSWFAAAVGGLAYAAFFKPSGFWYDLYRVDSLAYAFAVWSCWCFARKSGGVAMLGLGLLLAGAAHFTKQTSIFLPLLAIAARYGFALLQLLAEQTRVVRLLPRGNDLYLQTRAPILLLAPMVLVLVNWVYLLGKADLGEMTFYLYRVGGSHAIFYDKIGREGFQSLWQYYTFSAPLVPLALWASLLGRRWRMAGHLVAAVVAGVLATWVGHRYLALLAGNSQSILSSGLKSFASVGAMEYVASTWTASLRLSAAATLGGVAVWMVRWSLYRTQQSGLWWILVLVAAQHVAAVTWVKIGGYINNFMPLFVVQSVVLGLAVAWLFRGFGRSLGTLGTVLAGMLVLMAGWFSWEGTHYGALRADPSREWLRAALPVTSPEIAAGAPWWLTDGLRYDRPTAVRTSLETGRALGFGRPDPESPDHWILAEAAPLGRQLPSPLWREWGPKLLDRIAELHADGGVYLPHQNYLGYLAGVPIGPSIDAIRDVAYLNRGTPPNLIQRVREGEWRHIVTMMPLQYEWMTPDFIRAMEQRYERGPDLLPTAPWVALMPVTGVQLKPMHIYTRKGSIE